MTRYETDLYANGRGLLKERVGAMIGSFGVEAGRRVSLADHLTLIPQAWLAHSDVSTDDFRDAVGSRVSLHNTDRSIAGLGVAAEMTPSLAGGGRNLALRGRLGVEQVLGNTETIADVSGERLSSEAARTRGVLGVGAAYRWNQWSLGAEASASGSRSDDVGYAASFRLVMQF